VAVDQTRQKLKSEIRREHSKEPQSHDRQRDERNRETLKRLGFQASPGTVLQPPLTGTIGGWLQRWLREVLDDLHTADQWRRESPRWTTIRVVGPLAGQRLPRS